MLVIARFKLYLTEGSNIYQVENDSCDLLYVLYNKLSKSIKPVFYFSM